MTYTHGVKKSIVFISIALCAYVFQYAYNALFARYMSVAQYGYLSFSMQMIMLAVTFVIFCMPTVSTVFIPKYKANNAIALISEFMRWSG